VTQISKKKINKNLKKQIYNLFYQLITDIRNLNEAEIFLRDFLTENELEVLAKRLAIIYYLSQNRSYGEIKKTLAVSSTTISSVNRLIKKEGIQLALKKIQAEEWATKWTQKISKIMKFRR